MTLTNKMSEFTRLQTYTIKVKGPTNKDMRLLNAVLFMLISSQFGGRWISNILCILDGHIRNMKTLKNLNGQPLYRALCIIIDSLLPESSINSKKKSNNK